METTSRVREILSWYPSDNPGTLANLYRLLMHGRLAGTGKLVILPVDQGFEHGPARSFAPNPPGYDPEYHVQLAIDAGAVRGDIRREPPDAQREHRRRGEGDDRDHDGKHLPHGSVRPGGEDEVHRLRLASTDGHLLCLRTELLVPRRQRIRARRQPGQTEGPVLTAHREVDHSGSERQGCKEPTQVATDRALVRRHDSPRGQSRPCTGVWGSLLRELPESTPRSGHSQDYR